MTETQALRWLDQFDDFCIRKHNKYGLIKTGKQVIVEVFHEGQTFVGRGANLLEAISAVHYKKRVNRVHIPKCSS